jgi:hypothetical protein
VLKKLSRALEEFGTYIDNNAGAIVNYAVETYETLRAQALNGAARPNGLGGSAPCALWAFPIWLSGRLAGAG